MHRRYQYINIPTEIIRSIVIIAETGSFSKAGEKLGLSQPAISAQVKRLQVLVGGAVFERGAGGVSFTPKGKLVLNQARKLLEANDQILSLGGPINDVQHIRLGISNLLVERLLAVWKQRAEPQISLVCDHSDKLVKALIEGHLDVACLVNAPPECEEPVYSWQEDFVWVRAPSFVLGPGSPIPLVGWEGMLADQPMVQAVERAGLSYRIAFTSPDYHARMMAVAAGIGLMGVPPREVTGSLMVAKEYYLPAMAPMRIAIVVRRGVDAKSVAHIVDGLRALSAEKPAAQLIA
jgi:DNA-binding transcriptional LysR family regulator